MDKISLDKLNFQNLRVNGYFYPTRTTVPVPDPYPHSPIITVFAVFSCKRFDRIQSDTSSRQADSVDVACRQTQDDKSPVSACRRLSVSQSACDAYATLAWFLRCVEVSRVELSSSSSRDLWRNCSSPSSRTVRYLQRDGSGLMSLKEM